MQPRIIESNDAPWLTETHPTNFADSRLSKMASKLRAGWAMQGLRIVSQRDHAVHQAGDTRMLSQVRAGLRYN